MLQFRFHVNPLSTADYMAVNEFRFCVILWCLCTDKTTLPSKNVPRGTLPHGDHPAVRPWDRVNLRSAEHHGIGLPHEDRACSTWNMLLDRVGQRKVQFHRSHGDPVSREP